MAGSSSHHHHYDDSTAPPANLHSVILDISNQVALFRDLLINIGQSQDSPELREKIRKLRRNCVDTCKSTSQHLLPQLRRSETEGIPDENPHLVLLFFVLQLFLRELAKCHRLVQVIPMDMSGYYDNRTGPSNLGNVISQILLCKQITPDFNREELCSIDKDSREIGRIIDDIQEFMPRQEQNLGFTRSTSMGLVEEKMKFLCCSIRLTPGCLFGPKMHSKRNRANRLQI